MGGMPSYRIHRLRDHLRQNFRFAPHVSGTAALKPRDYGYAPGAFQPGADPAGLSAEVIEAESPYAAYFSLRGTEKLLEVGDVLETLETGELRIFKFVGFEAAHWALPEPKTEQTPDTEGIPAAVQ